jgi:hypothetical protein
MSITQFILFLTITSFWLFSFVMIVIKFNWYNSENKNVKFWLHFNFFSSILFMLSFLTSLLVMNEYKQKSEGKCPELEKIEYVYKIK